MSRGKADVKPFDGDGKGRQKSPFAAINAAIKQKKSNTAAMKAFIERFYCIAEQDSAPPLGRYEKYPVRDCALLMTSADDFFWTFEQAVSYYEFTLINYMGFRSKENCWRAAAATPTASPK